METHLQRLKNILSPLNSSVYLRLKEQTTLRGRFEFNLPTSVQVYLELSRTCLLFSIHLSPNTPSYFVLNLQETVSYRIIRQTPSFPSPQLKQNEKGNWTLMLFYRQVLLSLTTFDDCSPEEWDHLLRKFWNKTGFHQEFKPLRKVGKGASASVFQAIRLRNGQKVAVKAFSKRPLQQNPQLKEALLNEIKLMRIASQSPHENVLNLHEIYESENSIYLVIDFCSGGMLHSKLILDKMTMDSEVVKDVVQQILKGLLHLHSKNIVHRDIKLNNILLRKKNSYQIVIGDLGLATLLNAEKYLYTRCGTPGYVAPEILSFNPQEKLFNPNCDIFSAGSIFHLLLTGHPLFPGQTMEQVYQLNSKMDFDLTQQCYSKLNPEALDLLKKMLEVNPYQRIGVEEALQHSYFEKKEKLQKCESPVQTALPNHSTMEMSDLMLEDIAPKKKEFRKASYF